MKYEDVNDNCSISTKYMNNENQTFQKGKISHTHKVDSNVFALVS